MQAAGFDVIGARDLDADSLRNSFRDFMAKLQADPANTVAMIYLSGYGVQLAGENYYIPVDAKIARDTDIPIEGLRISDYTRQLASIPLKASIVVLDAARPQPFIEGGNPIAGGLSLVEPSPNMLIAFNAAPGTVAPTDTGNYGVYAQSLAEMIRTGGLSLPDVFDRVRLRVSETSKGAQVPWDDQKIQAPFTFFDRAADAPPVQGSPDQVAAIRDRPIRDLGAQEAFTAALTRDTMQGYEDFLAAYAGDPLAKRVRAILAARREAITWRRTYLADTPDAYWSYLRRYPQGPHAWDARRRLAILSAALEPPPSFAMIDYDIPPPPPDEFVYVDRPVLYFGDPEFDFAPPPPPPVYFLGPPPPDFVVLAPPIVAIGAVGSVPPAASDVRADAGFCQAAGLCAGAAGQRHLQQHSQHHRHQHGDQQPRAIARRGGGRGRRTRRHARAGIAAACCAAGLADPAGQVAGAAECLDQSESAGVTPANSRPMPAVAARAAEDKRVARSRRAGRTAAASGNAGRKHAAAAARPTRPAESPEREGSAG